jgi:WSC domain
MQPTLVITSLFSALVAAKPLHSLQARATVTIAGYDYAGCYTEATSMRAFSDKSYYDDAMTIEKCAAACSGYMWFGVEYGREVSV